MKDDAHKINGKTRRGALNFMFNHVKAIALRRISPLISAKNAKNILAAAENATDYIRRYCGEWSMDLWEQPDWPTFTWDQQNLAGLLAQAAREQGRLLGKMEGLGFDLRREAPDSGKVAYGADDSLYRMKATPTQESVKWNN